MGTQRADDDSSVVAVAVGAFHTCCLTEDGELHCWGGNDDGQCDVPEDLGRCMAVAAGGGLQLCRDCGR